MRVNLLLITGICFLIACGEKETGIKKPIVMGDTSTIVTEQDEQYLENYTQDIAPNNHKSSAKKIAQMMVEVDSIKASRALEESNEPQVKAPVNGFTISFNEFDVVFNGIQGHSANANQNEKTASGVSYIFDDGEWKGMKIQVSGLTEVTIQQKLSTRLSMAFDKETILLPSLGVYQSSWYNLVGKGNVFLATGSNSVQFSDLNNQKIKNALTAALKSKRKKAAQITEYMNAVKRTNSAVEAPCKIVVSALQFVIKGKKDGKNVKKLIRFDIPV